MVSTGSTEDAAARSVIAFQKPEDIRWRGTQFSLTARTTRATTYAAKASDVMKKPAG